MEKVPLSDPGHKGRRPYDSSRRQAKARQTRERIVDAARDLFLEHGYPSTTLAAVAGRADVAPDTVYKSFGTKSQLLKEVLDVVVAGDHEAVAVLDRSDPSAMRAEPDQHRQISMLAAGIAGQLERIGPIDRVLRDASVVDPEVARLRADQQLRQRRAAMDTVVSWIAAHGPLRMELSQADAGVILWTLASPEVHDLLRHQSGWSRDRYQRWLTTSLTDSLLGSADATAQG
jgi:AcrR family transcriptional regulator